MIIRIWLLLYLSVSIVACNGERTPGWISVPLAESHCGDKIAHNVELLGHIGGRMNALFVQDEYAYVGIGPRLVILDVSDPERVVQIGFKLLSGVVQDIEVVNGYAYVVTDIGGLYIIDVADPVRPFELGHYCFNSEAWGVALSDSYVYVAAKQQLYRVDIGSPATPEIVAVQRHEKSIPAYSIDIADKWAYIAVEDWGTDINAIEITHPDLPVVASYNFPDIAQLDTFDLQKMVTSQRAFTGGVNRSHRHAFTLTANENHVIMILHTTSSTSGSRECFRIYSRTEFATLEIEDPFDFFKGCIGFDLRGTDTLTIDRNHIFIAESDGGLVIMDISDPANPMRAGFYWPGPILLTEVVAEGDYAYISEGRYIWTIDVTKPAYPGIVGFEGLFSSLDEAAGIVTPIKKYITEYGVEIRTDNKLYYVDYYTRDYVNHKSMLTISDAVSGEELGFHWMPTNSNDLTVNNDLIYVVSEGMYIFRLTE